jgi:hypoxanthine phosphoribosyltransferase
MGKLSNWRQIEGVAVLFDELKFAYLPDDVYHKIMDRLAGKIRTYQRSYESTDKQLDSAIMVTMGGLLPGVYLYDHLMWSNVTNGIEFGTLGIKFYRGPGQPMKQPVIVQGLSISVEGKNVAIIDDLVDIGNTANFVYKHLMYGYSANSVILVSPFIKSDNNLTDMDVINYSTITPGTWVITPRERIETLLKRVPYWRANGATMEDCRTNLLRIGYPGYLIFSYLYDAYHKQ